MKIELDSCGFMHFKECYYIKDTLKRIGAWDKPNLSWVVFCNEENVKKIKKVSEDEDKKLLDDLTSCKIKELKSQYIELDRLKNLEDTIFKVSGMNAELYDFQKVSVRFGIANNDGVLLALQMGLGKSIVSLSMAMYLKNKRGYRHFLIVTPASLKWNWPQEIEKFTNEKYTVIDGVPKVRAKQWMKDTYFKIVNYEILVNDLGEGKKVKILKDDDEETILRKSKMIESQLKRPKILEALKNRGFDGIIVDEVHMIKTHASLRSKVVKKIAKKSTFRLGLTGTPIDGRLEELHSIMEFVRPGLFGSKYKFMERHATLDFWGSVKGYKNIKEITEKIKPYFFRKLKKDVLKDLPDKVYKNYYVELNKEERNLYNEIKDGEGDWEELEGLVKVIRCKQLCDHSGLLDYTFKKNTKFDLLFEILKSIIDENFEKVIIFSQYKRMTDRIIEELKDRGYKYLYICGDTNKKVRVEYQKEFNENDEIDIIIGTEAMSTGLNLTSASFVINFDDNWSNSLMEQREDRAHRIGQLNSVTVINFICKDTIEERIRDVLYEKIKVTDEVLGDSVDEMVLKRLSKEEIEGLL